MQVDIEQLCAEMGVFTAPKPYFLSPGISQKAQKYQVNIIFPSAFWIRKIPLFPSPKNSKKELLST